MWAEKFMAKGTTRIAASNISRAVLTPMSISPRMTLMNSHATSHTRPITAAELMSRRLVSVTTWCFAELFTARFHDVHFRKHVTAASLHCKRAIDETQASALMKHGREMTRFKFAWSLSHSHAVSVA
jgi:hypothetical protein